MRKWAGLVIRLGVTAGLLALVLVRVDFRSLLDVVAGARWQWLLAAVGLQFVTLLWAIRRWQVILVPFGIVAGFWRLTRLVFVGQFFNAFLPTGVGGDLFRAYYLGKSYERPFSVALVSTLLERDVGLCALLLIGTAAAGYQRIEFQGVPLLYLFVALLACFMVANLALFHGSLHELVIRLFRRFGRTDLTRKVEEVSDGLSRLRADKTAVIKTLGLSLVIQLLSVFIIWAAARAIHIESPVEAFLVFIPVIGLTTMIPLTINGFGLREGAYLLLFSQIQVPPERSITLSLIHFSLNLLSAIPGMLFYLPLRGERASVVSTIEEYQHEKTLKDSETP
ncbi:MAG: UPF0104 family protein [Acidobacteria bacterium]|nr:MAG: UPF0104 family protein [Acidobacteriota bacterium]